MSMNRHFWNDVEKFLDTASDAQLTKAKAEVFALRTLRTDAATRRDIKAVYRLIVDEIRTRAVIAQRRQPRRPLAVLA